jgi:putative endonuclease
LKLTFGIWNFIFGILSMAEHNDLGKFGEQMAVDFLIKKGYTILETNWFFDKAEIDIIAQIGTVLAVVEVKTRSSLSFGLPQDFVKPKKIQLLVKAINEYVHRKSLNVDVRFDIVAIHKETSDFVIEHIEDAFFYF